MKVTPKTEQEVSQNRRKLFSNGIYDFEIVKGADKVSKSSGKDMIELSVKVFDRNGDSTMVFDYLMDTDTMSWKLRHCCEAIGIIKKYEGGELVGGDFESGAGKLKLKIQKSTDPNYPDDKNVIEDYLAPKTEEEKKKLAKNHGINTTEKLSDEIPW